MRVHEYAIVCPVGKPDVFNGHLHQSADLPISANHVAGTLVAIGALLQGARSGLPCGTKYWLTRRMVVWRESISKQLHRQSALMYILVHHHPHPKGACGCMTKQTCTLQSLGLQITFNI